MSRDPWTAQAAGDNRFVVTVQWREDDRAEARAFDVDIISCAVTYRGEGAAPSR